MEAVYTRYRKLKKEIRDLAATDLQRVLRGFAARKRHGRVHIRKPYSAATYAASHPAATTNTGTTALGLHDKKSAQGHVALFGTNKPVNAYDSPSSNSTLSTSATVTPGSGSNIITLGAGLFPGSNIPANLYGAYRDLLEKKRDLKRLLKKFDEDFFDNWGRNPKKSDKEVIRPMYQSYHEVCNSFYYVVPS